MANDWSSDDPSFPVGELILAYHPSEDSIHNAKVLKVEFVEGEWRYLVHYLSNLNAPSDDIWLTTDLLMEVTRENLKKQLALDRGGPAGSRAKLWKQKSDEARREQRELALAYETMREEFTATYGSQTRGFQEYVSFHMKERAKAPGERRARPDGGFQFERVLTEEELSRQQAVAAANRGALLYGRATRRRFMYSMHNVYPPYYV